MKSRKMSTRKSKSRSRIGIDHLTPTRPLIPSLNPLLNRLLNLPLALHRDERGVISILSVFAVLILTALLGMVMNAGRQVDGKIRMQNAADAAAYSGATVIARAMNTLAFTNHLLCETFAMTAFLREANSRIDRSATSLW